MDAWQIYLFESHPEATLITWARRLNLFRFFRAFGGHANDGDTLEVAYKYGSLDKLIEFLAQLGIELVIFSEAPLQPMVGVSYRGDEFTKFPSVIPGTNWARQPGHSKIGGVNVFVWCDQHLVKISIGADYRVTEADVASAEAVEKLLAGVSLERVDPPFDTKNYICPKHYPAYFA